MVDFNSETIVTQPIKQINTFLVIELHYNIMESLELYRKQKYNNIEPISEPALKSRIQTLYTRIKHSITDSEINKQIEQLLLIDTIQAILMAFDIMDLFLQDKGVTTFLSERKYNSYNAWEEDEAKGV